MRVIPRIPFEEAQIVSFSVSEPAAGESAWSSGTVYKAGDRVINTTTHRTYESQQGQQSVVTISPASPGVVTWTNHGLAAGAPIVFSTTGALPTGMTSGTIYYVLADTRDTFKLATSIGGTAINTSGSQSGVHTATANPNKGNDPTTDAGLWWKDVGPTARYAPFDLDRSTAAVGASPMVLRYAPGQRIDAIGFVGVIADQALVEALDGETVIKSWTFKLRTRSIASWLQWLTTPFTYKNEFAIWDFPVRRSLNVRVTLTRATGDVSFGGFVPGRQIYLGKAQYNAENDADNFSKVVVDDDGETVTLQRKLALPRISTQVRFERAITSRLLKARRDLNAEPAFWSAIDDPQHPYFEAMQAVGVYGTFKLVLDQPGDGLLYLDIKEIRLGRSN